MSRPSRAWLLWVPVLLFLAGIPAPAAELQDKKPLVYQNRLGLRFCLIPAGDYLLGSPPTEAGRYWDEGPQHWVRLSAFYLSATEITNDLYGRFLRETGHRPPLYWRDQNLNAPDQPVVGVSWDDAVAFARWLSDATGETYRLPTEAEWEAAARGGLVGQPYPWGADPPEAGGKYRANYNPKPFAADGYRYTAPVGRFPPNGYQLYDLAGNVAEWCQDWYDPQAYTRDRGLNPKGPATGVAKVVRGGSWFSSARDLRCAARRSWPPGNADGFIGFRLVLQPAP